MEQQEKTKKKQQEQLYQCPECKLWYKEKNGQKYVKLGAKNTKVVI